MALTENVHITEPTQFIKYCKAMVIDLQHHKRVVKIFRNFHNLFCEYIWRNSIACKMSDLPTGHSIYNGKRRIVLTNAFSGISAQTVIMPCIDMLVIQH